MEPNLAEVVRGQVPFVHFQEVIPFADPKCRMNCCCLNHPNLMMPDVFESPKVHGRLDVQYDKLSREEKRFELAANEYRQ